MDRTHPIIWLVYNLYLLGIEWAAAIIGQRTIRKSWPQAYKWLVILCWATVAMETVDFPLMIMDVSVFAVYNIWAYLETGAIIYIQSREATYRWAKRLLMAILIVLTAGSAVNYIWGPWASSLSAYNPKFQLFTLFIQVIAACVALIDILSDTSDKPLSVRPAFWLTAGVLFSGILFTVIFIVYLFFQGESKRMMYTCYSIAGNTFMYGGFIACFLVLRKKDTKGTMATPFSNSSQDSPPPPLLPGS
jgi:hypothetical protein